MPVTPVGSLSLPAAKLRRMVSLSASFQSEISTVHGVPATPAGVLPWIFMRRVVSTTPRPYACITIGDQHRYSLVAGGDQNYLRAAGGLYLFLAIPTNPLYFTDPVQAELDACNWFGEVVDEIVEIAAQDDTSSSDGTGHLAIVRVDLIIPTLGENPEEEWQDVGRFFSGLWSLHWGDDDRHTFGRY
jgi:hypothetical protein